MRRALLLFVGSLTACGGAPVQPTPPLTLADTPEARAEQCGARVKATPDDAQAQRCWRESLARLRRLPEAVEALSRAREAAPDDARRWYFEVRARTGIDVAAAVRVARQCHERLGDVPDCMLADATARERAGDFARALVFAEKAAIDRPDAVAWSTLARLRLALSDIEGAASAAEAALKADPTDPAAQTAAARVALRQNDPARADAHVAKAIAQAPDAAEPLVVRARLHLIRNRAKAALADLRAAVAHDPEHAQARDVLATMLLDAGQERAAIEHLNVLIDRYPRHARYMVRLGTALLRTGSAQRALGWADLALGNDPENMDALTLRVRALIRTGAHAEAAKARPTIFQGAAAVERRILIAREWIRAGEGGRAESEFAAATGAHPRDPRVWRAYADWYLHQGRFGRASTLLRKGIEAAPDNAGLHADLATVLEKGDRREDARKALAEAARLAPDDPDHPDELARLEFLDREVDRAIDRWEAVIQRHPRADRARLRLSQAYRAVGKLDEAVRLLETLTAHHPKDATLLGHLGEVLLMNKRKRDAIPVLQRALSNGGDGDTLRPLLATALADIGDTAEARKVFDTALQNNPGNRALRLTYARFLERQKDPAGAAALYRAQLARNPDDLEARGRLGALGQTATQTRWPAADADPVLRALAARVPATSDGGATVLRDERYVRVEADGVASVRHVRSILIRRPAAAERHTHASISFHAASKPKVLRARTLTPDGESLPVPEARREVVNPHAGTPLYGDARNLKLGFARVEPGAIIDYEVVTRQPRPDLKGIWWDGYLLGNVDPTLEVRYELDVPAGAAVQFAAPGLPAPHDARAGGRRVLSWRRADLPAYDFERARATQVPAVYASNLERWADVDRWYAGLFHPQSVADEAVRARAEALVEGLTTRRARIAAIYRDVERRVEYLGIEFGIGAYQPRPANATLARGKGDCKDMTALMVAMLAAVGIEAMPALVRPRDQGGFIPGHASPGQFSHVLLYVPDPKGDLWLDATSGLGTLTAIPGLLRGQRALIVDGKGGRLLDIPDGAPEQHVLQQTITYALNSTGGGVLGSDLQMTGDLAGQARRRLLAVDAAGRKGLLRAPGYLLGNGRVPDVVTWGGLDDPEAPVTIAGKQANPDLTAVRLDGTLVLPFRLEVIADTPIAHSKPETWFDTPRVYARTIRLQAPKGYRFDWKPLRYTGRTGAIDLVVEERREGTTSHITTRLTVRRGRLDAADRAALLAEFRRAEAVVEQPLPMKPGAGFDPLAFLEAVARERPGDATIQLHLGRALLEANRPLEARVAIERAQVAEPDQPAVYALLAATYVRVGDFIGAEAPLRVLAARSDAAVPVFATLGTVLMEQERPVEAAEILQAGLAKFPGNPVLRRRRIAALGKAGRPADALREARRLVQETPDDASLHALIGDIAGELGATHDAEEAYRAALALDPQMPRILNNLAWLLRHDPARLKEAIRFAEQALTIDPDGDATWDTLAELRLRSGDRAGALEALEEAEKRARSPERKAFYRKRRAAFESGQPLQN